MARRVMHDFQESIRSLASFFKRACLPAEPSIGVSACGKHSPPCAGGARPTGYAIDKGPRQAGWESRQRPRRRTGATARTAAETPSASGATKATTMTVAPENTKMARTEAQRRTNAVTLRISDPAAGSG